MRMVGHALAHVVCASGWAPTCSPKLLIVFILRSRILLAASRFFALLHEGDPGALAEKINPGPWVPSAVPRARNAPSAAKQQYATCTAHT